MLRAKELETEPEKMVEEFRSSHMKDLGSFNISHDNFYTTHSEENKYFSELIYNKAKESGFIESKQIEQLFDESAGLFLSQIGMLKVLVQNVPLKISMEIIVKSVVQNMKQLN